MELERRVSNREKEHSSEFLKRLYDEKVRKRVKDDMGFARVFRENKGREVKVSKQNVD